MRPSSCKGILYSTVAALGLASQDAASFAFSDPEAGVDGSLDTTVAFGTSMRMQAQSSTTANTLGNRNFDKYETFSSPMKVTTDLGINWKGFTLFARGSAFYDFALVEKSLPRGAEDAEKDGDLLDAYIGKTLELAPDVMFNLRLGRQVISWGESTFIGNSINSINTFDLNRLRVPGSELKEALMPTNMVYGNLMFGDGMALEMFYLLDWEKTRLDARGTYFSTNDSIGPGSSSLQLGPFVLPRDGTDAPKTSGQWGVAFRKYFAGLGNGVEAGLYFYNTHSTNPIIATKTPSPRYFFLYPENLRLYGASFNTRVGPFSWSGEYSFRDNAPIQRLTFLGALAPPPPGGVVFNSDGRVKIHQAQTTLQQILGKTRAIGADNTSFTLEVGGTWTPDDNKYADTTFTSAAWGYVVSANATYNRLIGNINVTPLISFSQNVAGTLGPFSETRKGLTVGFNWGYSSNWAGSVLLTKQYGDAAHNPLTDRDFLAAELKRYF